MLCLCTVQITPDISLRLYLYKPNISEFSPSIYNICASVIHRSVNLQWVIKVTGSGGAMDRAKLWYWLHAYNSIFRVKMDYFTLAKNMKYDQNEIKFVTRLQTVILCYSSSKNILRKLNYRLIYELKEWDWIASGNAVTRWRLEKATTKHCHNKAYRCCVRAQPCYNKTYCYE